MSRLPRLDIGSSDRDECAGLAQIFSQFPPRPFDACVVVDNTTDSDSVGDESSDDYWGTDEDWELIDQRAVSTEEFNRSLDH